MKNYYQILGIEETASKEQIRIAYKRLSLKCHPDKNNGDDFYSELFKNINEAHQVLSNDFKRAEYDFLLNDYINHIKKWQQPAFYGKKEKNFYEKQIKTRNVLVKTGWVISLVGVVSMLLLFVPADDFNPEVFEAQQEAEIVNLRLVKDEVSTPEKSKEAVKKRPRSAPNEMKEIYASVVQHKKQAARVHKKQAGVIHKKRVIQPKKPLKKTLSQEQMVAIYTQIISKKRALHTHSTCVRIIKTNTSNLKNAFAIATFLKRKGYTIAGREKINDDFKGFDIAVTNNCITVKIGTL